MTPKRMPDGTEFVDPDTWPEGLMHNLVMPDDGPAYIQLPMTPKNLFEWCNRNGVDYGEIDPGFMGLPPDYPETAARSEGVSGKGCLENRTAAG